MRLCHSCGQEIPQAGRISRQEICPHCRADLHCCFNCSLYDENAENHCREPSAEWVSDREKNNFCDYFDFRDSGAMSDLVRRQKEARAKLEALFAKKPK
jgi:hypothetical protein